VRAQQYARPAKIARSVMSIAIFVELYDYFKLFAINIGVFGADVGYLAAYEKGTEAPFPFHKPPFEFR
jgi:hypothetical protein